MKLFECGIRYDKTLENGSRKKVTELYVVDALSFSEAESRVISEMSGFISGEFEVVSEKITNYSELLSSIDPRADKWYRVKIKYVIVDEKTEKEKRLPKYLLVQAREIDHAREITDGFMRGTMVDWDCEAVQETRIMDVFMCASGDARKKDTSCGD